MSALCATSGFVFPALSPLVFFGFSPLLAALMYANGLRRIQLVAIGVTLGGAIAATSFYPIFWHILPLNWADIDASSALKTVFGVWVYFMGLGALGMAFFPYTFGILKSGGVADVLLLPCIWVLFEYFTGLVYALGVYQPLVELSPNLSLGALSMVGHLATDDTGILQVAALGGSFGLSYVVVFCNGFIAYAAVTFSRGERLRTPIRAFGFVAAVWVAAHLALPPQAPTTSRNLSIALISTRSPHLTPHFSAGDAEFMARINELGAEASDAALIVFPEGTNAFASAAQTGTERPKGEGSVVLDSRAVKNPNIAALRRELEVFDTKTRTSQRTYKRFLVPVGEYTPLALTLITRFFGGEVLLGQVKAVRSYVSGEPTLPITTRYGTLGAHFCEEILSPTLYQQDVARGADILVNVASHAWYHDSNAVFERMKRVTKVRAAESRRFVLVASDGSPSFVLDPYGRTVAQSAWGEEGVLRATVQRIHTRTPYSVLGPHVLLLPLALCFWALLHRINAHRQQALHNPA